MKKITLFLSLVCIFSIMISGCKKDNVEPNESEAFVNLNDYSTTSVISNIPRIVYKNGTITMFISVTDQDQQPIYYLNEHNFRVDRMIDNSAFESVNGVTLQSSGGPGIAQNFAAALTMDYSGSMHWDTLDIPAMESAVKYFIKQKDYYDAMEIIKFDHNIYLASPFTTDSNILLNAVDSSFSLGGSTAFYRALLNGLGDANAVVSTLTNLLPAVIGFTDGVNNQPPLSPDTVINVALTNQIPIYTIGYNDLAGYADTATLHMIADTTGGRYFWCPSPNDLQQLYQYVNGQLTSVYVIEFPFTIIGSNPVKFRVTTKYECAQGPMYSVAIKSFNP